MVGSRDLPPDTNSFGHHFWNNQFKAHPTWPAEDTDLSAKTAIVTGSNTGLGFESAKQLLNLKLGQLIMAVRSVDKGELAADKLRRMCPKASIQVWQLDMASYDSIEAFAKRAESLPRIDYVLLNAGLYNLKFNMTARHEEDIMVNYLSTVFLAMLLLPVLKSKGSQSVLTIVNAALALTAKFPQQHASDLWKAFDDPKSFNAQEQYHTSKMLAHIWLWNIVDYVSAKDVVVNLADCAWVKGTSLSRSAPWALRTISNGVASIVGRSVTDGASCFVDALLNHGPEAHGGFYMSWKMHPFNSMLYDKDGKEMIEKVWTQTLDEFEFANIRGLLQSFKE